MRILFRLLASALALVSVAQAAQAQTTMTNQAGGCSTGIFCSLPLAGGTGSVTIAAIIGPNCLLGQTCSFPSGYVGTSFAYQWPDGSFGAADNFTGTMAYTGSSACGANCAAYAYTVTGIFSGQDSKGRAFTGSTRQAITVTHESRGGNNALDNGGATTLTFAPGSQPSPPPDFSLAATPTTLTLQTGQSVVTTLTLAPAGGFSGTQNFTCSGLPASTSCSFNPPMVIADGSNTPLITQMTINTGAKAMMNPGQHEPLLRRGGAAYQVLALFLPCTILCWESRKKRRIAHVLILLALLLATAIGSVSCGGGASRTSSTTASAQTPVSSQTTSSTVVVTAANPDGASHSVSINLTLMP